MGEATEDEFAGRVLYKAKGDIGERKQQDVRDPGIISSEVESLGQVVVVDENEDVEVQQVQSEGSFAEDDQRTKRKDRRDEIGAGESKNQQAEERRE